MKILFACAEASPFIKVGGLGDVMGALPKELVKKGIDARVILPYYEGICTELKNQMRFIKSIDISISWRKSYAGLLMTVLEGVTYYFIDNERYFKRNMVYGYDDDGERFAFFSKSVLDFLNEIDFIPDIININDWHTSMISVYLDAFYRQNQKYKNIKTVLSIHNIEFQGKFDPYVLGELFGLDVKYRPVLMYDGCLNLLKGAIEKSDMICTVSKNYSQEILHYEHSFGLNHILRLRECKLRGIINGLDTDKFNPQTDKFIKTNYSYKTIHNKRYNKINLQKHIGLEVDKNIPLISMVTRLTTQKGIDLFYDVIDDISSLDIQIVVLGTGEKRYEDFMSMWQDRCPNKFRCILKYSNEMASMIYAGSDLFLMPSKSEPCGLSQMIAMRYGSVPIVHTVGGLKDTVDAFNTKTKKGNGITFQSYNPYDMLDSIKRAISIYNNKKDWNILRKNAMTTDVSWSKRADEYINMYNELL